jgi:hypothetical protein
MGTELDVLVVGNAFLEKINQVSNIADYLNEYEPD